MAMAAQQKRQLDAPEEGAAKRARADPSLALRALRSFYKNEQTLLTTRLGEIFELDKAVLTRRIERLLRAKDEGDLAKYLEEYSRGHECDGYVPDELPDLKILSERRVASWVDAELRRSRSSAVGSVRCATT